MTFQNRFVDKYLNPLEVEDQIADLVTRFPQLCRVEELPFPSHGYQGAKIEARGQHKIKVLRITAPNGMATKPAVLLMRSTHAREWINPIAVLETAQQLLNNFQPQDVDPKVQEIVRILNKVEFFLIPETNPDGTLLTFFDEGRQLWRKNARPPSTAGGCAGVDCNRNFPRFWGEAGSSGLACAETFRGPAPLSEPEAANVAHLAGLNRNIIFAIDSHSFGQALFRPHQPQGISVADDDVYRVLEQTMNDRISQIQGVTYSTGTTNNFAGTSDDYLFLEHRIFGFALECGQDFQPPIAEGVNAALEVAEAAKALGLCAAGEIAGIDVGQLLQQRPPVTDADTATTVEVTAGAPWKVEPLPPEQWPRFLVQVLPKDKEAARREYEALVAEGFDARYHKNEIDVVVSAKDLTTLVERGFELKAKRDLLHER